MSRVKKSSLTQKASSTMSATAESFRNAFQPGMAVGTFRICQYKQKVTFYNYVWLGLQRRKPRRTKFIYLYF